MDDLFNKQFVIVAGKGGVGRTTVSMIVGHCAARAGRRTLVCLCNAPPRYTDMLGGVTVGSEMHQITPGLFVLNLDPVAAREEYGLMILRNAMLHRFVFGGRTVQTFLDAVPGLAEWAMFGKATFHALQGPTAEGGFDLVVFDSPATGHGLELLSLPEAIVFSVPAGRIKEEARQRVDLLTDWDRCTVLPVTISEEMPINEAIELVRALRGRNMAVERIVLNMTGPSSVKPELAEVLDEARSRSDLPPWLVPAAVMHEKQLVADRCRQTLLEQLSLPILQLPELEGGVLESGILELARNFYGQLTG